MAKDYHENSKKKKGIWKCNKYFKMSQYVAKSLDTKSE